MRYRQFPVRTRVRQPYRNTTQGNDVATLNFQKEVIQVSSWLVFNNNDMFLPCDNIFKLIHDAEVTEKTLGAYLVCKRCNGNVCVTYDRMVQGGALQKYEDELVKRMMTLEEVRDAPVPIDEMNRLINLKRQYTDELDIPMRLKLSKALGLAYAIISPYSNELNKNPEYVDTLIAVDKCDSLPFDYETIAKVIKRCKWLKQEASDLWTLMLSDLYNFYFTTIYTNALQSNIPKELLVECLQVFPNVNIAYAIKQGTVGFIDFTDASNIKRLGFEDTSVPLEEIKERYLLLENEEERKKFVEEQRLITKEKTLDLHPTANTRNITTLQNIIDFYHYDVLKYEDGDVVFFFTTDDCTGIQNTGVNPYTMKPIHEIFMVEVARHLYRTKERRFTGTVEECIQGIYDLSPLEDLVGGGDVPFNEFSMDYNARPLERPMEVSLFYGSFAIWSLSLYSMFGFEGLSLAATSYVLLQYYDNVLDWLNVDRPLTEVIKAVIKRVFPNFQLQPGEFGDQQEYVGTRRISPVF